MAQPTYFDFEVTGRGEFPFDMLRYGECFPVTPEDAAKLGGTTKRTITLRTARAYPDMAISRFASFGWAGEMCFA